MSDRAVTALGVLAALAILMALLFAGRGAAPVGRPTSVETGPNGYAGLARWLGQAGVPVISLRERLTDTLSAAPLASDPGHLLITTMPHRARVRLPEGEALAAWIARGNTLLVLAALDDTPDWALAVDSSLFREDLTRLTGLRFRSDAASSALGSLTGTTPVSLVPRPAHPLMHGVERLEGATDSLATLWRTAPPDDGRPLLELAAERSAMVPAMWQVPLGAGHVVVSGLGSLLTNRCIGAADNRTFVGNLLRHHLAYGGAVAFDDMHQGLSVLYDPEAFYGDPRLGATLAFLLGFWALYLLGSGSRLVAPRRAAPPPSQDAFVTGLGGFLASKLSPAAAGELMLQRWFDELRGRGAIGAAARPWPSLAALSAVDRTVVSRLEGYHAALERGGRVDLRALHNTIEELRRMLR